MARLSVTDLAERLERLWPRHRSTHNQVYRQHGYTRDTKLFFSWWWLHWLGLPETHNRHAPGIFARLVFSIYFHDGHTKLSQTLARKALDIARTKCQGRIEGLCALAVGCRIYDRDTYGLDSNFISRTRENVKHLKRARTLLRDAHGDEFYLFQTLSWLAQGHRELEELPEARECVKEASELLDRMWDLGTDKCNDKRQRTWFRRKAYRSRGWRDLCVNMSLRLANMYYADPRDGDKLVQTYSGLARRALKLYGEAHAATIILHKKYADTLLAERRTADAAEVFRVVREWNRKNPVYGVSKEYLMVQTVIASLAAESMWYAVSRELQVNQDLLVRAIEGRVVGTTVALLRIAHAWMGQDEKVVEMCELFGDFNDNSYGTAALLTMHALEEKWAAFHRLGRPDAALRVARGMLSRLELYYSGTGSEDTREAPEDAAEGLDGSLGGDEEDGDDDGDDDNDGDDNGDDDDDDNQSVGHSTITSSQLLDHGSDIDGFISAHGLMNLNDTFFFPLAYYQIEYVFRKHVARWRSLRAHWNLAWSLSLTDSLDEATFHLHKCLNFTVNASFSLEEAAMMLNVFCQLAYIYELMGRAQDAATAFAHAQRALLSKPHTEAMAGWFAWNRGKMFLYTGRYNEALECFLFVTNAMGHMFAGNERGDFDAEDTFAPRPRTRGPAREILGNWQDPADLRTNLRRASTNGTAVSWPEAPRTPRHPSSPAASSLYAHSGASASAPTLAFSLGGSSQDSSDQAGSPLPSQSPSSYQSPRLQSPMSPSPHFLRSPRAPETGRQYHPPPPYRLPKDYHDKCSVVWEAVEAAAFRRPPPDPAALAIPPVLDAVIIYDPLKPLTGLVSYCEAVATAAAASPGSRQSVNQWMMKNAKWPFVPKDGYEEHMGGMPAVTADTYQEFVAERNESEWLKYCLGEKTTMLGTDGKPKAAPRRP